MAYNVLIVDDSATMRALVRKILAMSGFDLGGCFESANGREALKILEKHWIDLILSDVHMPEMDGAAFLQALRAHKLWRTIPVVLITTESRQEVLTPILRQGAQGYIKKPFQPEVIRNQLVSILGEAAATNVRELEGCDF
ncbi:MAG: response regulator [Deltaproteobacteria bacterium]|nr:response regulator [Deltaproteobacteria bacterium]